VSTPTPRGPGQERDHEAVIAGLRARRRARMKLLARRSAFGSLAAIAVAIAAAWWLLATIGGRDVLLNQIVARLPAGTSLEWQRAEGPASGPLTLHGVRFVQRRCPDVDGRPVAFGDCATPGVLTFTARTVVLDPALRPLLGRRLRLDALDVRDATLDLPATDEPFELPEWPEVLPDIAPPLALQADTIRIDGLRVARAGAALVDIARVRGGLDAAGGRLHVERLLVESDRGRFTAHGDYAPRDRYRSDLVATAVLPAPAGRTPPTLALVARGDLARMDVALAGRAPAPLRATLTLRGDARPRWGLRAATTALDPALLSGGGEAGTPLAFDLRATGVGGGAELRGSVSRGDPDNGWRATLQPSRVELAEQVLTVAPLVVDTLGGRIRVQGRADLRETTTEKTPLRFSVNARGLRWGGTDAPAVRADADFGLAGKPEAWAAIGQARIARGGERATLDFDGRGDTAQVAIRSLRARMPSGALDARGTLAWSPALRWDATATLSGFDPGYLLPPWPGAVDGRIASRGNARAGGGFDADIEVPELGGRLRGRALDGRGDFTLRGAELAGELALALGASRVEARGRIGDRLDLDARFAPLRLDDLWPDAAGTLRGTLALDGPRNAPGVQADLAGSGLRWGAWRAEALQAHGRLPWRDGGGALALDARGLDAGLAFESLQVEARGAVENLQLDARAQSSGLGTLALAGSARKTGMRWQGTLATLRADLERGADWTLQQPAAFAWDGRNGALSNACLASSGGGRLCAGADWPRRGLDVTGSGLPLALLVPHLPAREDGRPWLLRGAFALDGSVRPAGGSWRGQLRVTSPGGGMKNSERARRELVSYAGLVLAATFDPRRFDATLGAVLNEDGRIDARIASGWDAYAPLSGELAFATDALTWMELFSPDIVEPTGRLDGRITLGGTRAQPALGGQARLAGFATEIPALAIRLTQGEVRLDALADGTARIAGSVRSGEGTLAIDGTLGWQGTDTPLVLAVRGANVLASDTRDLHAVIDPDLTVRYRAGQPLDVTGTVGVPEARVDLERLDRGVSTSGDVVVLDPEDPDEGLQTPLQLDLTLALGEDVRLDGFGLDGSLTGRLRVRQRPGREMTASGALDVAGQYTAYGQKLDITRGELSWNNNAIANPALDIRAEREVGDVTAGIQVTGRATSPQAEVWANPAMDESEALAYLALGRPLSTASGEEGRQLDAASAALSAGGSLLASQLGARIGLDAGVVSSRTLGGSVFGVGKYLSPRLYVGYGVSLLGTGQVLTLKYLLRKGFDIEIESSTIENRASLNWRMEK
jgi:translocation and assembly module TamB